MAATSSFRVRIVIDSIDGGDRKYWVLVQPDRTGTIGELKQLLAERHQFRHEGSRLLLQGSELVDCEDCRILQDGDVISVITDESKYFAQHEKDTSHSQEHTDVTISQSCGPEASFSGANKTHTKDELPCTAKRKKISDSIANRKRTKTEVRSGNGTTEYQKHSHLCFASAADENQNCEHCKHELIKSEGSNDVITQGTTEPDHGVSFTQQTGCSDQSGGSTNSSVTQEKSLQAALEFTTGISKVQTKSTNFIHPTQGGSTVDSCYQCIHHRSQPGVDSGAAAFHQDMQQEDSDKECETREEDSDEDREPIFCSPVRGFTNSEVRHFIKSYCKFGNPWHRLDAIARDAKLQEKPRADLKKLMTLLKQGCDKAMREYEEKPKEEATCDGKKSLQGPMFKLLNVKVNVKAVTQSVKDLEPLTKIIPEDKQAQNNFQLTMNVKPVHWDCSWNIDDDSSLLKGVYTYGMGSWEAIKTDPELGLTEKILPDGDLKPKAKHLQTRVEYLLRVVQKFLFGDTKMEKPKKQKKKKVPKEKTEPQDPVGMTTSHEPDGRNQDNFRAEAELTPEVDSLCKEKIRPVNKMLVQLDNLGSSLSEKESHNHITQCLVKVGDHISECLKTYDTPEKVKEWRRHLWVFVSKFTELDASKLQMLYKQARQQQKEDKQLTADQGPAGLTLSAVTDTVGSSYQKRPCDKGEAIISAQEDHHGQTSSMNSTHLLPSKSSVGHSPFRERLSTDVKETAKCTAQEDAHVFSAKEENMMEAIDCETETQGFIISIDDDDDHLKNRPRKEIGTGDILQNKESANIDADGLVDPIAGGRQIHNNKENVTEVKQSVSKTDIHSSVARDFANQLKVQPMDQGSDSSNMSHISSSANNRSMMSSNKLRETNGQNTCKGFSKELHSTESLVITAAPTPRESVRIPELDCGIIDSNNNDCVTSRGSGYESKLDGITAVSGKMPPTEAVNPHTVNVNDAGESESIKGITNEDQEKEDDVDEYMKNIPLSSHGEPGVQAAVGSTGNSEKPYCGRGKDEILDKASHLGCESNLDLYRGDRDLSEDKKKNCKSSVQQDENVHLSTPVMNSDNQPKDQHSGSCVKDQKSGSCVLEESLAAESRNTNNTNGVETQSMGNSAVVSVPTELPSKDICYPEGRANLDNTGNQGTSCGRGSNVSLKTQVKETEHDQFLGRTGKLESSKGHKSNPSPLSCVFDDNDSLDSILLNLGPWSSEEEGSKIAKEQGQMLNQEDKATGSHENTKTTSACGRKCMSIPQTNVHPKSKSVPDAAHMKCLSLPDVGFPDQTGLTKSKNEVHPTSTNCPEEPSSNDSMRNPMNQEASEEASSFWYTCIISDDGGEDEDDSQSCRQDFVEDNNRSLPTHDTSQSTEKAESGSGLETGIGTSTHCGSEVGKADDVGGGEEDQKIEGNDILIDEEGSGLNNIQTQLENRNSSDVIKGTPADAGARIHTGETTEQLRIANLTNDKSKFSVGDDKTCTDHQEMGDGSNHVNSHKDFANTDNEKELVEHSELPENRREHENVKSGNGRLGGQGAGKYTEEGRRCFDTDQGQLCVEGSVSSDCTVDETEECNNAQSIHRDIAAKASPDLGTENGIEADIQRKTFLVEPQKNAFDDSDLGASSDSTVFELGAICHVKGVTDQRTVSEPEVSGRPECGDQSDKDIGELNCLPSVRCDGEENLIAASTGKQSRKEENSNNANNSNAQGENTVTGDTYDEDHFSDIDFYNSDHGDSYSDIDKIGESRNNSINRQSLNGSHGDIDKIGEGGNDITRRQSLNSSDDTFAEDTMCTDYQKCRPTSEIDCNVTAASQGDSGESSLRKDGPSVVGSSEGSKTFVKKNKPNSDKGKQKSPRGKWKVQFMTPSKKRRMSSEDSTDSDADFTSSPSPRKQFKKKSPRKTQSMSSKKGFRNDNSADDVELSLVSEEAGVATTPSGIRLSAKKALLEKLKAKHTGKEKSTESSPRVVRNNASSSEVVVGSQSLGRNLDLNKPKTAVTVTIEKVKEYTAKCTEVLGTMSQLLARHPPLGNAGRMQMWWKELGELKAKTKLPGTTIAVVGDTGAGKSSLLNALLDHADILPTSGIQACTAVVVEVTSNPDGIYEADIEFLSAKEWYDELENLLGDLTGDDGKVKAVKPDLKSDAGVAWSKVRAVYGVFKNGVTLDHFKRITTVTRNLGSIEKITENRPVEFRKKIDHYIKSSNNTKGGEHWPIIKHVKLRIPNCDVCSSGASLVDLPGTRDSNEARDKIAKNFLKKCNAVWVVAVIHRAVNNKTAKEMLGHHFRRQLLMDGQYGSVSFVCTKTDQIRPSEIIRDLHLADHVRSMEAAVTEIETSVAQLRIKCKATESVILECEEDLEKLERDQEELNNGLQELTTTTTEEDEDVDSQELRSLRTILDERSMSVEEKNEELKKKRLEKITMETQILDLEKELTDKRLEKLSLCTKARNKYCIGQIKKDFKEGLKEMKRKSGVSTNEEDDDEDEDDADAGDDQDINNTTSNLRVFCVSAMEYLKLTGKLLKDGPAQVFSNNDDTQVPLLRDFVHEVTSRRQHQAAERLLRSLGKFVADVHSYLAGTGVHMHAVQRNAKPVVDRHLTELRNTVTPLVKEVMEQLKKHFDDLLEPNLKEGANNAAAEADSMQARWGSQVNYENPGSGGYHWSTYRAACRRLGRFRSPSSGQLDFNENLAEPMYTAVTVSWDSIFNDLIWKPLDKYKQCVLALVTSFGSDLSKDLRALGLDVNHVNQFNQLQLNCATIQVNETLADLRDFITEQQREINRALTPNVQEMMVPAYAVCGEQVGKGTFSRMREHMDQHVNKQKNEMFDQAIEAILRDIVSLQEGIETRLQGGLDALTFNLCMCYEPLWEDHVNTRSLVQSYMADVLKCSSMVQKLYDDAKITDVQMPKFAPPPAAETPKSSTAPPPAAEMPKSSTARARVKVEPSSHRNTHPHILQNMNVKVEWKKGTRKESIRTTSSQSLPTSSIKTEPSSQGSQIRKVLHIKKEPKTPKKEPVGVIADRLMKEVHKKSGCPVSSVPAVMSSQPCMASTRTTAGSGLSRIVCLGAVSSTAPVALPESSSFTPASASTGCSSRFTTPSQNQSKTTKSARKVAATLKNLIKKEPGLPEPVCQAAKYKHSISKDTVIDLTGDDSE